MTVRRQTPLNRLYVYLHLGESECRGGGITKKLLELMKILGITPSEVSDSLTRAEDNSVSFNNNFDKRLRLQKAVFLIKHKTKDFPYPFSLYIRGPYSKELARDYYGITDNSYTDDEKTLTDEARKMAEVISDKDNLWLEIASTIVMFSETHGEEKAVERTKEFKEDVLLANNKTTDYVNSVYEDIKTIPFPIFNPLSDRCHIYPMM